MATSLVRAKVDVTELMGNEIFLYLITGTKTFIARVDPRVSVKPGDEADVVANMANLHAFDPKTEAAIC